MVEAARGAPRVVPRATYRLQLHAGFDFAAAAALADYLAALGVSHVYSSPYLQAAPGSTHGYDVVDPRRVNAELGGPVAHQRFSTTLGEHGLGQVLDVVPNHMAIGGPENPWWWDVLENGPASRYARFFDVEWDSHDPQFQSTVLLPVLGDHYGRVLEAGDLQLVRERGSFVIRYGERSFPVAPPSLEGVLVGAGRRTGSDELVFIGEEFGRLPASTMTDRESVARRHRGKEVLKAQLGRLIDDRSDLGQAVDDQVALLNEDVDRLDALIEGQNYRLAYWRAAGEDLDYRRFFDVTGLAGLRIEDEHVFNETHELILGWLREGVLDGVRIDHPDGLRDPRAYFDRLHAATPRAWIVAEKILEPGEQLRGDWPVAGTTGYDFLNEVNRLFVDPSSKAQLSALYASFRGNDDEYEEIVRASKKLVLQQILGAELNRLTEHLLSVVRGHRRHRDYSRGQLRSALRELIGCFPVYRTYVRAEAGEVSDDDIRYVMEAVAAAAEQQPDLPRDLFEFIADVLLLRMTGANESEFAMRFQQLTGPVMAKGVEDTTFYRFNRLVALNEVGGDPSRFGQSLADFHAANQDAQRHWPTRMLASSTHDTKRSEDVRIRIALLSEMPDRWADEVETWQRLNAAKRSGDLPDGNTEYLLYQTLVGTWPIDEARLREYMLKAVREAKTHTSWTDPNEEYEAALATFVKRCLTDAELTTRLDALMAELTPHWHATSLSQTLLRLTCPGAPDIYQGTELWDLSLVDPDNRRPVDFELRRKLLDRAAVATAAEALSEPDEGLPKIWLIRRVLEVRRRWPELFGDASSYAPMFAEGARADHVVAFARGGEAVVVAPRLVARVAGDWQDTSLTLGPGAWEDQLTGTRHEGGSIPVAALFETFPVALLMPSPL
ncbi:MAG TPA: malto-oligosyltrehalose synthase [Candidatus Limnocylindrales bacterium]|nr:malto-oligosyltrehalose synthase [Candidatus Limnocylindrales bacterium]